ncbi:2-C-methyl-D-erythritol 4-phosphate cytidylyltransferase [Nocardioides sp.]|jgi:2-C-methyl-D-erythritol 4-phosphate cytidylyltransferase|uniref:2-C-methyl-D-erythritol 4-phosphate cytidylyltransferase n=1 Tax=Nocardioides sp. TaxID=35761 RepID=UPI00262409E4|nr:2-C-methyl-D-erythritol 4-phosphate cytidylyltransferase [Nocardioides sp.]
MPMEYDVPDALGIVLVDDRGSLPFALIHGEALVAAAAWSLGESGITPVDLGTQWAGLVDSGEPVVLHDVLCPMTPPSFLAECLIDAVEHQHVVIGVRPVSDTVKQVVDGFVGATLDRDDLVRVCSPIVLPPAVVAGLDLGPDDLADLAALAAMLRDRYPVRLREAPPEARRVDSADDVAVLEALTAVSEG